MKQKNNIVFTYFAIGILFYGCQTGAFIADENFFIGKKADEVWWMFNVIGTDSIQPSYTMGMFSTVKPVNDQVYAQQYIAEHSTVSAYYFLNTNKAIYNQNNFPITCIIPYTDSLGGGAYWELKRNKLVGVVNGKNNSAIYKQRFDFTQQIPFRGSISNDSLGMFNFSLINANSTITNKSIKSKVFIHRFNNGKKLIELAKNYDVLLLDFMLWDGTTGTFLFYVMNSEKCELIALTLNDHNILPVESGEIIKPTNTRWTSDYSSKDYQLDFDVKLRGYNFEVKANDLLQEFQMKKSSFWLGNIDIINKIDSKLIGKGILYNFNY